MEEEYVWRHAPLLWAAPRSRLNHELCIDGNEVYERAVYLLENDTYLFISYNGLLDDPETGVTDLEEVETYEEALEIFE